MPELPEVETTRRGILPHVCGRSVTGVEVREPRLRWPVTAGLAEAITGARVSDVQRRGKYLLVRIGEGCLMIHLGMSGSLRILPASSSPGKHDHLDISFGERLLRFTDPRRFGSVLWLDDWPPQHPLLDSLGPEPLSDDFTGDYFYGRSRGRKVPVKSFLMDSRIVVGVGNIYANEALFSAGIHPLRQAGRISSRRCAAVVEATRDVLERAIEAGGTTLRDFTDSAGKPGYFVQKLRVYGRGGQACRDCGGVLKEIRLGGRSTVYCPTCQR